MSVDSDTADGAELEHPRACPLCGGFGAWRGDTHGAELIVECVTDGCGATWSAPDKRGGAE